jgi:hypothetical protein
VLFSLAFVSLVLCYRKYSGWSSSKENGFTPRCFTLFTDDCTVQSRPGYLPASTGIRVGCLGVGYDITQRMSVRPPWSPPQNCPCYVISWFWLVHASGTRQNSPCSVIDFVLAIFRLIFLLNALYLCFEIWTLPQSP